MKDLFLTVFVCFVFLSSTGGCTRDTGSNESTDSDEDPPAPYPKTAGFVSIPQRQVAFNGFGYKEQGLTTAADIFYSFVPSKKYSAKKPVFVFFNGGPGAATSTALSAWGTGPNTISESGDFVENPQNFSDIGNLIYIDTRQAGFSFDELPDPSEEAARIATFNFINYNIYTDVSDILIALLRILAERPELEDNPVVVIAESYGGARAAILFSLVLDFSSLESDASIFQDRILAEELRTHFERISTDDPAASAKRQFARQVLIQPGMVLPMKVEAAHTLYSLCDHLDANDPRKTYCEGGEFDYSDIREPEGFFNSQTELAQTALMLINGFESFYGISTDSISQLIPDNRPHAFRFSKEDNSLGADIDMSAPLSRWDAHHITMNIEPYMSWQDEAYDAGEICAHAFVGQLAFVHTFITDAYYDFAMDSSELPDALMEWNLLQETPVLRDAHLNPNVDPDATRPGWMEITFAAAQGVEEGWTRVIRMPEYMDSGHMVTLYQALDFLEDVRAFLIDSELYEIDDAWLEEK